MRYRPREMRADKDPFATPYARYASQIYVPDDQSPPAYCTVFGHIMKCGGSTIKSALETAQPPELPQPGKCISALGISRAAWKMV